MHIVIVVQAGLVAECTKHTARKEALKPSWQTGDMTEMRCMHLINIPEEICPSSQLHKCLRHYMKCLYRFDILLEMTF